MKELSVEEKAKAYDEAIEKFDAILNLNTVKESGTIFANYVRKIFPELKESEDEKMRKGIIHYLEQSQFGEEHYCIDDDIVRNYIAYLEKQGEQNKQEKDIILCHLWHGESEKCLDKEAYILFHSTYDNTWNVFTAGTINWNVVDKWAYLSDIINIVNKDSKQGEQKPTDTDNRFIRMRENKPKDISEFLNRLTTVEQEFLWEHIAKIRELDKEEQKPAWSEEDKTALSDALWCCEQAASIAKDENDMGNIWYAKNWLKSLKYRVQPKQEWKQENIDDLTDFEIVMMHIGASFFGENAGLDPNDTTAIKEQANILSELVPKQEWSEEEEKMFKLTENLLLMTDSNLSANKNGRITPLADGEYSSLRIQIAQSISWLKSLKDRKELCRYRRVGLYN